jgi:hypothetical protein
MLEEALFKPPCSSCINLFPDFLRTQRISWGLTHHLRSLCLSGPVSWTTFFLFPDSLFLFAGTIFFSSFLIKFPFEIR